MPTSRCIILAGLDDVIESCLPNDQFKVTQVDPESGNETHERVVLVVLTATDDVRQVRQLCASMQNRFGQSVPLLACAGRYVFPTIRPLLETDLQGLIVTPFDASEFRAKTGFLRARVEQDDAAVCDMPRKISKGAGSCQ